MLKHYRLKDYVDFDGPIKFQSIESDIRRDRNRFLRRGSLEDRCIFYIALTPTFFKYGVTADIKSRLRIQGMHNDKYLTLQPLIEDSRLNIANLEASIKYQFGGHEYLSRHDMKKFFEVLKSNLEDIDDKQFADLAVFKFECPYCGNKMNIKITNYLDKPVDCDNCHNTIVE
jgi:hypothetical protein